MNPTRVKRRALLLALNRRSRGDVDRNLSVSDVAAELKLDERELEILARQLDALGFVKMVEPNSDPFWVFRMTMRGVEEAEKMEGTFARWADENPKLYAALLVVITSVTSSILTAILLTAIGLKH